MRIIERKEVKEVKARVNITVPAWIMKELGFKPGDSRDWFLLRTDDGEIVGCLRRVPKDKSEATEV